MAEELIVLQTFSEKQSYSAPTEPSATVTLKGTRLYKGSMKVDNNISCITGGGQTENGLSDIVSLFFPY